MWHNQCAWCGRLKHQDGTPHGRSFPLRPLVALGYSHGVCAECKPKLLPLRLRPVVLAPVVKEAA